MSTTKHGIRRLFRNADGVAAVEFALVAMPFLMMCLGMLQFLFLQYNQDSLSDAVFAIASQPAPASGDPKRVAGNAQSDYKTTICNMNAFSDNCTDNLKVERYKLSSLSSAPTAITGSVWEGVSGDVVVLRAQLRTLKVIGFVPSLRAKESAVYRLP